MMQDQADDSVGEGVLEAGGTVPPSPRRGTIARGVSEIWEALSRYDVWLYLAWKDIRLRYRTSTIGPLWITLSTGAFIATVGLVFGRIFDADINEYLPFLTAGYLTWSLIAMSLGEGSSVLVANAPYLKDMKINVVVLIMRAYLRHLIVFFHNLLVLFVVYSVFGLWPGLVGLLAIPGLVLLSFNLLSMMLLLGVVGARYRDVSQIVQSLLQVLFLATPIMWMPHLLSEDSLLLLLNPFAHLIDIVRQPMLGQAPGLLDLAICVGILLVNSAVTVVLFSRKRSRLAFWV